VSPQPVLSRMPSFFGATGGFARKKIFPALQNMAQHGTLKIPVIGVAKSRWTIDQLRERARDSIVKFEGGVGKIQGRAVIAPND
jgi:glucose-6-phosphate 1-dehydrogenase